MLDPRHARLCMAPETCGNSRWSVECLDWFAVYLYLMTVWLMHCITLEWMCRQMFAEVPSKQTTQERILFTQLHMKFFLLGTNPHNMRVMGVDIEEKEARA